MAKIDLDALNIDELASLRDRANEKLAEKVRRARLSWRPSWHGCRCMV